jgi:HSP20 family protein
MTDHGGSFFLDIERHLDEAFDKLIYRRCAIPNPAEWKPRLDLHETGDGYYIEVDLPGVPPEHVEIRVTEGCLSICGKRPEPNLEGAVLCVRERERGCFGRSLFLRQAVAPDRARAECQHGTYKIHLFKKHQTEAQQPQRDTAGPGGGRLIRIESS